MRKSMKLFMVIVLTFVMCISSNTNILYAESVEKHDTSEEEDILGEFLTRCYAAPECTTIMDEKGNDITDAFLEQVNDVYLAGDFDTIRELISDKNYSLKYTEESEEQFLTRDIQPRAFIKKTVTDTFYQIGEATTAGYRKEWLMRLTGSFTYNANTFEITNASAPTLSIDTASFGAAFSPYITNVTTSYQMSKYSVTFTGTYKMMATLGLSEGNIWISRDYDFGTHTVSLVGEPD